MNCNAQTPTAVLSNKVLSCVNAILDTLEEGSDEYMAIDALMRKLNKKTSYEDLLDKLGIMQVDGDHAPGQEELEWQSFLGEFGLKPPNEFDKN